MNNYSYYTPRIQKLQDPQPYSSAWFEKLWALSPSAAVICSYFFLTTGRTDVCCGCGDEPTHDYRWNGIGIIERLCVNCKRARETIGAMNGNPGVLIPVDGKD